MKYETTAMRIREAMNDLNITQQELADKSKIGKSSISHYVNGTNEPGNKSAYILAQTLDVNPAWLMGLDAPKKIPLDTRIAMRNKSVEPPIDIKALANMLIEAGIEFKELETIIQLYTEYRSAPPQIKKAIETLLKPAKSDS